MYNCGESSPLVLCLDAVVLHLTPMDLTRVHDMVVNHDALVPLALGPPSSRSLYHRRAILLRTRCVLLVELVF